MKLKKKKKHLSEIELTYELIKFRGKIKTLSSFRLERRLFLEIRNTIIN